jgi:hypothetical protein
MRVHWCGVVTAFALFLVASCWTVSARATPPVDALAAGRDLDLQFKTIKVRKLARKILGIGAVSHDNEPLYLGPLRTTFLWRLAWRWNEKLESALPHGLRGGPVLSFDLPLEPWVSVEARVCALRYVYARTGVERPATDELADPKHERRSLEAGMFMNIHFDGLL